MIWSLTSLSPRTPARTPPRRTEIPKVRPRVDVSIAPLTHSASRRLEKRQFHRALQDRETVSPLRSQGTAFAYAQDSVERAAQTLGIQFVPDINSPDIPAAHTAILDVVVDEKAQRNSTYHAFLPPQLTQERKTRLNICTSTTVCRIELSTESDGLRATGVHLETTNPRKADCRYVAKARREVIVCAGAIGSPQVLMLRYILDCVCRRWRSS